LDTSPWIYPWKKQRILSLFQAPGFNGVNPKSKIQNPKLIDAFREALSLCAYYTQVIGVKFNA